MKYNQLNIPKDKSANRVGRGISAGQGKTAGRGTKGQKSRTGSGRRPGFEGGQTPLHMRIPKLPGFRSIRPKTEEIKTASLNTFTGKVTNQDLFNAGLISSQYSRVKIIEGGAITKKLDVSIQVASKKATGMITESGGTVTIIARPQRTSTKNK